MNVLQESKTLKRVFLTVFTLAVVILLLCFNGKKIYAAEDDIVYIPDANFKALLNETLGVDNTTADITEGQMATITELEINAGDNVTDITGIGYCTNLTRLYIYGEYSAHLEMDSYFEYHLSQLKKIKYFTTSYVDGEAYSFIKNWIDLRVIYISYNESIVKLPDFSKCLNISAITISSCDSLTDISPIADVQTLKYLYLQCESVTNISPIKGKTSLTFLDIRDVKISNDNMDVYMDTISSLTNLDYLHIQRCDITDEHTSMFDSLTKILTLELPDNDIESIDFLLSHKDVLGSVDLQGNKLSNDDIEELVQLTNLYELDIHDNDITDFTFILQLPKLKYYADDETVTEIDLIFKEKPSTFVIMNEVKDAAGNYVTPIESNNYTYNKETREITFLLDSVSRYVEYSFTAKTVGGYEININHRLDINVRTVSDKINRIVCLGEDVQFSYGSFYFGEHVQFEWYKDGDVMEGETGYKLAIDNVILDDAGIYKVIIKSDYTTAETEYELVVKPYKDPTVSLKLPNIPDNGYIYVGDEIDYTVIIEGGSGDFSGTIYFENAEKKRGIGLDKNFTDTINVPDVTGDVATYVEIYDRDLGELKCSNDIFVKVYNKLEAGLKINDSDEDFVSFVGNTITLNAVATGGREGYTYKYVVENVDTGDIAILKDYSEAASYSGKFISEGTKKFTVYVKDLNGREVESNSITVIVYNQLLTLDGTTDEIIKVLGDEITLKVENASPSSYTYKYVVENLENGYTYTLKDYTGENTCNVTFSVKGKKRFIVYAKDSSGNVVETNSINAVVYEKALEGELIVTGVSENMTACLGDKISLEIIAEGGSENYTYYKFYVSQYGFIHSLNNKVNITLTRSGDITLYGIIDDSDGNIAYTETIVLTVYDRLEGNLELSELYDGNKTGYMGAVTYAVTAAGGSGNYTYKYVSENLETGEVTVFRDNHTCSVYRTRLSSVGENKLTAYVIDSDGHIAATNSVIVTVYGKPEVVLQIDGISEKNTGAVGKEISLNATATGGYGSYLYKYMVENVTTGVTVTLKNYSEAISYVGKFTSSGKKRFIVYVRDSVGNESATEPVDVTVYDSLTSSISVGSSISEFTMYEEKYITFSATAAGGSGNYTYSFIVYNNDTKEWYRLADNSSSNRYRWQPISAGNRTFYVDIKDTETQQVVRSDAFAVKVLPKLKADVTLIGVSDIDTAYVGDKISCTVSAVDGAGGYMYNYIVEVDGVRESTGYIFENVFEKSFLSACEINLYVYVLDSAGNVVTAGTKFIRVFDEPSVVGTLSATEKLIGEKITIISNLQGGVGAKKYTYKVYNKDTKKWYTLDENVTNVVYVWTTNIYGNLEVYIEVEDCVGTKCTSKAMNILVYRKPGLYKAADGNSYYLEKEEVATTFTGLAQNEYGWWYVKNGKVDFTYTGMATNQYGTWYMKKGKLDTTVSGLVCINSEWLYLSKGKLDTTFTGLAQNKYGWWYVKNGKVDFTYTGMATNQYGTWYMKKGKLDTTVSGLVCINSEWLYLSKGKLDTTFTGLAQNKYGWWYVKNGKVDFTYTGMATNQYGTWYMKKGKLDTTVSGLVCINSEWLYLSKGKLDTTFTGLAQNKYGWWYVKEGILDFTYTGMAKNEYGWFYMKNGKFDTTYTGIATNEYGMWYMKNGKLDKTYTGTVEFQGKIYNVIKGKVS